MKRERGRDTDPDYNDGEATFPCADCDTLIVEYPCTWCGRECDNRPPAAKVKP